MQILRLHFGSPKSERTLLHWQKKAKGDISKTTILPNSESPTNLLKSLKMSNSKDIDLPTCQDCHFSTCQTILELNILPTLKRHRKCSIQANCQEAIKKIVDIFQHAKTFHQWEVYCKLCTFKSLQKLTPRIVRKHLDCFKCYKTCNCLKLTQMWENPQSK